VQYGEADQVSKGLSFVGGIPQHTAQQGAAKQRAAQPDATLRLGATRNQGRYQRADVVAMTTGG
jgi:hypothetical protein